MAELVARGKGSRERAEREGRGNSQLELSCLSFWGCELFGVSWRIIVAVEVACFGLPVLHNELPPTPALFTLPLVPRLSFPAAVVKCILEDVDIKAPDP